MLRALLGALAFTLAACPAPMKPMHVTKLVEHVGEGEGEGEGEGPSGPLAIVASPLPGVFSSSTQATLSLVNAGDATLTLFYTADGSLPVANVSTRVTGSIDVAASTELRVIAVNAAGEVAASFTGDYLLLDADAASFSSNIPLVVLWGTSAIPQDKNADYADFTLLEFTPNPRVQWPSAADASVRAGIKIHGSTSADYPKKPWRVKVRNVVDDGGQDLALLGMPPSADWILGAPLDFDRSLMRTTLIYDISRSIGRYAPRTVHAEVFIAGDGGTVGMKDYVGVYEVTERIERDPARVDVQHLHPGDVDAPAVTGGYLFKQDRAGPGDIGFTAGDANGAFAWTGPFFYVDPDQVDVVAAQDAYITSFVDDVGFALASPDHTSPTSGLSYDEELDVPSFIDHHIVNVFAKNPDAFRLSGYYNKDRNGPLVAGPVWDFDRTMGSTDDGRSGDPEHWDASNITTDTTYVFDFGFYRGLFQDPAFTSAYWARWADVIDVELSPDVLDPFIDEQRDLLEEAAVRNFARWSDYPPSASLDDEAAHLKAWVNARHDWIKSCLALPDPTTCPGD